MREIVRRNETGSTYKLNGRQSEQIIQQQSLAKLTPSLNQVVFSTGKYSLYNNNSSGFSKRT